MVLIFINFGLGLWFHRHDFTPSTDMVGVLKTTSLG